MALRSTDAPSRCEPMEKSRLLYALNAGVGFLVAVANALDAGPRSVLWFFVAASAPEAVPRVRARARVILVNMVVSP